MHLPRWLPRPFRRRPRADALGRRGERAAARALRRGGYRIVARRLRLPGAEVDILAVHRETVVLVEVKTTASPSRGAPAARVDVGKRSRLARARRELARDPRWAGRAWRLDVVAVTLEGRRARCEILEGFAVLSAPRDDASARHGLRPRGRRAE